MIRTKVLLAVIGGLALVGIAIGALAMRSRSDAVPATNSDVAVAANSPGNPAQADQSGSTADQSTIGKSYQPRNAKVGSSGRSTPRDGRRSVYYNYNEQPKGRTFWQKHRDKLTVAGGVGAGALVGGLIGGKKGAGIGMLAGGGSSALYTYKLRHKRNRY